MNLEKWLEMIKFAFENKDSHVIFMYIPYPEENVIFTVEENGITIIKTNNKVENCVQAFGLNILNNLPKKPPVSFYT